MLRNDLIDVLDTTFSEGIVFVLEIRRVCYVHREKLRRQDLVMR
jgi:hypothetical protein